MNQRGTERRRSRRGFDRLVGLSLYGGFAALELLLHAAGAGRYGMFRDEFYYLACADRLAWGYVDHPPLSIALLAATRSLLGDSLPATRAPAILVATLVVLGSGLLARRLGGGRFAQALAMASVLACPMLLAVHSFYSMNTLDHLFWLVAAYLLVRLIDGDDRHHWLVLGAVCGLGLLNKTSMAFFGLGLVVAVVASPLRRSLRTPWPYLGGATALLVYAPNLVWQLRHDFAMIEFLRNAEANKNAAMAPLEFLGEVVKSFHPVLLPVWLAGVVYPFARNEARTWRPLAVLFLCVLAVFLVANGKPYYVAPAFPMIFALGAVGCERFSEGHRRWRVAGLGLILAGGALLAPIALPLLPPASALAYMQALGMVPKATERGHGGSMPQHFADRFGWRQRAELVRRAYGSLSSEEQSRAVIIARNYGEAAAMEYYAEELQLPPAVSFHNNYWLWGPGRLEPAVNLLISRPDPVLLDLFASVEDFGTVDEPFQLDLWRAAHVYVVRGLKRPVAELWSELKLYQ